MSDPSYTATVPRDLEDLVPTFLENRRKELESLRASCASRDYEQLRQLGHRMRGVGSSYGFDEVSTLGKRIEDSARQADASSIEAILATYADYLQKVRIVYE